MGSVIHTEVLLAVCYAVFLMAVAGALELAARYAHHRSARIRVVGFHYDPDFDLWTCPNGQKLLRAEADYRRNVVLYRAAAHACNTCPMKARCTDSDRGRTIELAPDSWLQSELRRFHRGMSLALFGLAAMILLIEFFRYGDAFDRTLLGTVAIITLATGSRLGFTFARARDDGRY
jgi:hypothetical protein